MPSLPRSERLLHQIQRHRAGERVGNDERRRGEIVRPHIRIDPSLEVAIAGQHRDRDEIVVGDRFRDRFLQRSGISDAGGAAEADEIEAELVEIGLKTRLLEIFLDDLRTRRERCLDPWLCAQSLGDGVARKQTGRQHDAGVGGVGARRNRRDHDIAVAEIERLALDAMPLAHLRGLAEFLIHGAQKRPSSRYRASRDPAAVSVRPAKARRRSCRAASCP